MYSYMYYVGIKMNAGAQHGAEQEMERCIPVLASFLPNVQRDKALAISRKVTSPSPSLLLHDSRA